MDDYINRTEAKRLIADIQLGEAPKDKPRTVYQSGIYEGLNMAYGAIASMRPADVRPVVRGEWQEGEFGYLTCSVCGCDTNLYDAYGFPVGSAPEYHNPCYCPHCGADMRPEPPEREVEA